jgi:hypothetical protein
MPTVLRRSMLLSSLALLTACHSFGPADDPSYRNLLEAAIDPGDLPIIAYSGILTFDGAYPSLGQTLMLGTKPSLSDEVVVFTRTRLYLLDWEGGRFISWKQNLADIQAIRLAKDNFLLHRIEIDGPNPAGTEFLRTIEFLPSRWTSTNPGVAMPFDLLRQLVRPEVAAEAKLESSYSSQPPARPIRASAQP